MYISGTCLGKNKILAINEFTSSVNKPIIKMHFRKLGSQIHKCWHPRQQSSWGQYGAHLGPVGPRWAPCWHHEPCYQGLAVWLAIRTSWHGEESLRWRHNGRDSVSNHQPHDCLLNRLFRRRSKKTSKLRVTGLCAENSPETGEFSAQMASNAENVSIWWRHHGSALQALCEEIYSVTDEIIRFSPY